MKNIISADAVKTDKEKLLERNRQFLTDTFIRWYGKTDAEKAQQSVKIVSPKDIDWETKKDDKDRSKFGEYTINPNTVGIDWENIPPEKIKALDFAEFVGRPIWELAKHIAEKSDKYHIPGIEYLRHLIENEEIPKELKDGNYYYFFGSILRDRSGDWDVLFSCRNGRWWHRYANWLENDWLFCHRVLLLEK